MGEFTKAGVRFCPRTEQRGVSSQKPVSGLTHRRLGSQQASQGLAPRRTSTALLSETAAETESKGEMGREPGSVRSYKTAPGFTKCCIKAAPPSSEQVSKDIVCLSQL